MKTPLINIVKSGDIQLNYLERPLKQPFHKLIHRKFRKIGADIKR